MAKLFDRWRLRGVEFKNRICVSPMCQYACAAADGVPHAWHLVHLGSRAVGGAALVISEATAVQPDGRISPQDTGMYTDAQERAFREVAATVKRLGAIPGIQLAHAGRKASTHAPWAGRGSIPKERGGWAVLSPVAVPFAADYAVPRAMTGADIDATVAAFAQAAQRSARAGFEVLELHFAHGYLVNQFLAPELNTREDAYGGPALENRARLALQIVDAVRTEWPARLPLFVRLSATQWLDVKRDVDEAVQLGRWLRARGVDLIDCSSGGLLPGIAIPVAPGYQVPFAAAVRQGCDVATGAVGLITDFAQAEQIVAGGKADAVLLARALLRDPYWPLRAAAALGADAGTPPPYQRAFAADQHTTGMTRA